MPVENEDNFQDAVAPFHVTRVAVKPPPFWKPDPRLWFAQVEAQFARAGISSDETKYFTVVAEIDSAVLGHASDIISAPASVGKYDALKQRLIGEFGESNEKWLRRLVESCELGEKKATSLLREMKDLANQQLGIDMLKSLWLRCLPVHVQQILATIEGDVDDLTKKADDILAIPATSSGVDAINTSSPEITATISELVNRLNRLESRDVGRRSGAPPQRARSVNSGSGAIRDGYNDFCWYHRTFGEKAT
ncbi:uncharacterized protein LOC129250524 [Anastrepha obliqua]|uniref:uncharacterized protein LOC129250524 n=1 Tax=Anastrepha obliqua TaxID=95512 RepID=UPI00240A281F|nr:uncharacterized protein LOC129250524 [Anastrepha obliqua]